MATQSTTDVVFTFGTWNYGAAMTDYTVTASADISGQVNHGEEMHDVAATLSQKGTWMGISAHSTGGTVFTVTLEGSAWADAAAVQVALRTIGGNFATCTVA